MADLNIDRINELYHKSQKEGLTEEEKKEQAELRRNYVNAVKATEQYHYSGRRWKHH